MRGKADIAHGALYSLPDQIKLLARCKRERDRPVVEGAEKRSRRQAGGEPGKARMGNAIDNLKRSRRSPLFDRRDRRAALGLW